MPPKKKDKAKKEGEEAPKENPEDRDLDKETVLKETLDRLTNELEEAKKRVISLKEDNEWLEQESVRITEESHEYMNFMSRKANMRQNSIITLSDQNKQEIENLKIQKDELIKEFEAKKQAIQNNLIQKQNMLNKVKAEIEEMSEYKELKQSQQDEIAQLENNIIEVRKEQTKVISKLRSEFIKEKFEHKREADHKIATIVKAANKEARECLSENTLKIKQENQRLRSELLELINTTKDLKAHKQNLEKKKLDLLKEINYAEDLKKVRSTQQDRMIIANLAKRNEELYDD